MPSIATSGRFRPLEVKDFVVIDCKKFNSKLQPGWHQATSQANGTSAEAKNDDKSEHLAKLVQGVEVWNQWAELETDSATNLSGTDFELADQEGGTSNRIRFRGAYLVRVNLVGKANLELADLSAGNLSGANLKEARRVRRTSAGESGQGPALRSQPYHGKLKRGISPWCQPERTEPPSGVSE